MRDGCFSMSRFFLSSGSDMGKWMIFMREMDDFFSVKFGQLVLVTQNSFVLLYVSLS